MTSVLDAIKGATPDTRVRQAMALGAGLEGGLSAPFGVGDNGGSWGPYQINHNSGMHADISRAGSEDPVAATRYMLGEYTGAVDRVPSSVWASDPEKAAETAAFLAERPAVDYFTGRGQQAVDTAWSNAQTGLGGGGGGFLGGAKDFLGSDPFGLRGDAIGGANAAGGAISGAAGDAAGAVLGGLGKLLLPAAALVIGGALVVVGLYTSVSKTAPMQAAKGAATTAATAAAL